MSARAEQARQVRLGLFLFAAGYHPAGWRLPGARAGGVLDPAFLHRIAQTVERGRFDFVELVVPELQRRGLLRMKYEGETFRELLGVERPANVFA